MTVTRIEGTIRRHPAVENCGNHGTINVDFMLGMSALCQKRTYAALLAKPLRRAGVVNGRELAGRDVKYRSLRRVTKTKT